MKVIIEKPDIKNWPDSVNLEVNGVSIRIEYENQQILVPTSAQYRQDEIGSYLIDEGFIKVNG